MNPPERPDFGPSGYLPERASKRARKIILRAPLGMQWIVGALVAGAVVLAAGTLFLQRSDDPPPEPWTAVGTVDGLPASAAVSVPAPQGPTELLVVTRGGRIRAFADAPDAGYCAASNRLEAADGRSWTLTGRGVGTAASLEEHPTLVHDGVLYVDPTQATPGPDPLPADGSPGCGVVD